MSQTIIFFKRFNLSAKHISRLIDIITSMSLRYLYILNTVPLVFRRCKAFHKKRLTFEKLIFSVLLLSFVYAGFSFVIFQHYARPHIISFHFTYFIISFRYMKNSFLLALLKSAQSNLANLSRTEITEQIFDIHYCFWETPFCWRQWVKLTTPVCWPMLC